MPWCAVTIYILKIVDKPVVLVAPRPKAGKACNVDPMHQPSFCRVIQGCFLGVCANGVQWCITHFDKAGIQHVVFRKGVVQGALVGVAGQEGYKGAVVRLYLQLVVAVGLCVYRG